MKTRLLYNLTEKFKNQPILRRFKFLSKMPIRWMA